MMKSIKEIKARQKEKFNIPKKAQDIIPIKSVYKDGIFKVGNNLYSKTFKFSDINYHIASDEEKQELMKEYWSLINSFSAGVQIKLTVSNHRLDLDEFRHSILLPLKYDNLDKYRREYNQMLLDKAEESNCIVQDKYFTITVSKKNIEDARAFFARISTDLSGRLLRLGSKCTPLDAAERLKIFYSFYNHRQDSHYNLNMDEILNSSCDIRDYIAPDSVEFESDAVKLNSTYCRTVFARNYGTFVDDDTVSKLTSINKDMMLSVDFIPISADEANREVDKVLLGIQTDKANYNRKQAKNNNFGSSNYDLEERESEVLEVKNDMRNRDQKLFHTVITMAITADTKDELDSLTDTIFSKASDGSTAQFGILRYQQLDALNTVLPFGICKICCFRTLTTESLAAFMPFHSQEVRHEGGTYYGQNAISGNMIFVNRQKLLNGNCIVLGVSGGGKSFFVKENIASVYLSDENADIVIIDPEREYNMLVNALGGEVINISAVSENHINAMDMNPNYEDERNPVATKSEFIMSLCEQLIGGTVDSKDKSIIDRCCRSVYAEYIKNNYRGVSPTLKDFKDELLKQNEEEAHQLALAMELFTDGSLNTFAKHTNVDISKRLISYDILDLGEQLLPVGMLVVLDNILNRVTANRSLGRTTYIFIDEIYLLFEHKYTADFLYRVWKRVRKYGAFATGITQNVGDMLLSNTARTMLSNSEFTVMLNQNGSDKYDLSKLLNITENQTEFFTNVEAGHGLMKIGGHFIPYVNEFPKNTLLYRLMTTKPGEAVN